MTKPAYQGNWARQSRTNIALDPQCAWCEATDDLVTDHLVPGQPRFGTRTLCRRCNSRRAAGSNGPPTP